MIGDDKHLKDDDDVDVEILYQNRSKKCLHSLKYATCKCDLLQQNPEQVAQDYFDIYRVIKKKLDSKWNKH